MYQRVNSTKLIVVDLETTCTNTTNAEQNQNEIIEIGMAIIDMKKLIVEQNVSLMVKPQRSEINDFCTKLTGIKPEDVKDGFLLPEATDLLISSYQTNQYVWASWGDFDRLMINRESKFYKAKFPFNRQHLNVKAMFGLHYGLDTLPGLGEAVKLVKKAFIGTQHRGVDDARNTAELFIGMVRK